MHYTESSDPFFLTVEEDQQLSPFTNDLHFDTFKTTLQPGIFLRKKKVPGCKVLLKNTVFSRNFQEGSKGLFPSLIRGPKQTFFFLDPVFLFQCGPRVLCRVVLWLFIA